MVHSHCSKEGKHFLLISAVSQHEQDVEFVCKLGESDVALPDFFQCKSTWNHVPVDLPGFCACQDGYSGTACEIELATPPMLLRIGAEGSNGICDLELNSLQACRTAVLRGNRFLPGSICRITTLNVSREILTRPIFSKNLNEICAKSCSFSWSFSLLNIIDIWK